MWMSNKAEGLLLKAAYIYGNLLWPGAVFSCLLPSAFRRRRGQNTVEYMLMLAVVASMAVIMLILFHKKILGGIFTLAGLIMGAGTPK